jgi:hypothetical protein
MAKVELLDNTYSSRLPVSVQLFGIPVKHHVLQRRGGAVIVLIEFIISVLQNTYLRK